ncbi:MAG: hypothetical protein LBU61_00400, partial [Coriobacteriales bacterium]|nr:hypothetical protein [Coriobacteriales bacterium]
AKKVWDFNDIFEELPEGAVATFSNGFELDVAKQVDAWSQVSFEENSAWSAEMIFDDGILYRVWYELVGVTINGQSVNTINFKAHANREYIVEFTNKFFKEQALDDPTYTVDKVWLDENGAPISFALVNSRTGGASVTFSSSIDGVIQLNTVYTVDPFTTVEITEGDVALYHGYTIDGVYYPDAKFVLDYAIHTVDGVDYAGAEFVAEDGMDYVVTLYNKLVLGDPYVPPTILITEKIPSTEHFDLWWQYGVLCYSSNTTPNGEYFIGFAPDFWDKYDKATIGFGVANDIEFTAIFTKDSTNVGGYVFYAIPADWTPHYSNGVGFVGEEIRGVWFDNPFGTGSRQAYFLEIVLKP